MLFMQAAEGPADGFKLIIQNWKHNEGPPSICPQDSCSPIWTGSFYTTRSCFSGSPDGLTPRLPGGKCRRLQSDQLIWFKDKRV